jgi:hypothetical protein
VVQPLPIRIHLTTPGVLSPADTTVTMPATGATQGRPGSLRPLPATARTACSSTSPRRSWRSRDMTAAISRPRASAPENCPTATSSCTRRVVSIRTCPSPSHNGTRRHSNFRTRCWCRRWIRMVVASSYNPPGCNREPIR